MLKKRERFIKWLKVFKKPLFKGLHGKLYWLFKWRPGHYESWQEFKDDTLEKK